ncbi:hypothetical protein V2J09_004665 [Rumex salicifolius]
MGKKLRSANMEDMSSQLRGNLKVESNTNTTVQTTEAIEQAECECCGIKEECTTEYVSQVRGLT